MKNLFSLLIFLFGISLSVSAKTITITTASGADAEGTFYDAFRRIAEDGDVIEFDIADSNRIFLEAILERRADKAGTSITINGINKATGKQIVINGEKIQGIYRTRSGADAAGINITFNNLMFYKGHHNSEGGAFSFGHSTHESQSVIVFNGCTFELCSSNARGGAINAGRMTDITIENCTFINNTATQGGAVAVGHSTGHVAKIINCTFYENEATATNSNGDGGALFSNPGAVAANQVINCTFVKNIAVALGGGVAAAGNSATTLVNCIVAGNDAPNDVFGKNLNLNYCIVEAVGETMGSEENAVIYDISVFAGGEVEIADNGGPTNTVAISKKGAAFQAGIAALKGFAIPSLDQRGVTRLNPPCIGSYDAAPIVWTVKTAAGDNSTGTFSRIFRYNAEDSDIIEFNIAGTDEIVLDQILERRADKAGTSITINGINKATGNPIVIHGGKNQGFYRSCPGADAAGVNLTFNNLVFYKGRQYDGSSALSFGHSTHEKQSVIVFNGCTFEECSSSNGGAINAGMMTDITIENCTFINNFATQGGAIAAGHPEGHIAKIINCTFYKNNAGAAQGGALFSNPTTYPTQVINCTFVGNISGLGAAVAASGDNTTNLVNCLIAENDHMHIHGSDVVGRNLNLNYCIVEAVSEYIGKVENAVAYNKFIFKGGAAELKDNGGFTKTIAIEHGGPAFQAGIAALEGFVIPITDQRGVDRLNPPCIGAYDNPSMWDNIPAVKTRSFVASTVGKQIKVVSENQAWITVYNLTGNLVDKAYVNGNTILSAELPSGIYIVRLAESDGNVFATKVIVK